MKIGLRELSFFLLLLGIVAAAGYIVFLPNWQRVQHINKDNQDRQGRLAQLDRIGQTSESLNRELGELAKALDFFESKLPDRQQIDSVLRELTQITDKHRLTARTVRTLNKQNDTGDYVAQPIEMEIVGPFEGYYQFLLDLEKLPRITRISQMEINKEKDLEGQISSKMVVSVYFEPSQKPGAEATGASRGKSNLKPASSGGSTRRR